MHQRLLKVIVFTSKFNLTGASEGCFWFGGSTAKGRMDENGNRIPIGEGCKLSQFNDFINESIIAAALLKRIRQELPYGLRSPRNATRGLQSVLQAYIIKHFIFDMRPRGDRKSVPLEA